MNFARRSFFASAVFARERLGRRAVLGLVG
jgi:hypothetical protein